MVQFDNTEIAFKHKSTTELKKAQFLFGVLASKPLVDIGKGLTNLAFALHLPIKPIIKATLFKQFVGGESIEECDKTAETLAKFGIGTILDYSVEGKSDEASFDAATEEILKTVERAHQKPYIPFAVFKVTGLCKFEILEKVNFNKPLSPEEQIAWEKAQARVDKICGLAYQYKCKVLIDAEETWIQETIDRLAEQMMKKYNREEAIIYNTTQMYRHDRLAYIKAQYEIAVKEGYKLGLKIVRGAYMEKEREYAAEHGLVDPIQPNKEASDRDFNAAVQFAIEHLDHMAICAGTHNEESCQRLVQLIEKHNIAHNDKRVYFAQLLGMSDNLSFNLSNAGFNVAKYVPYGPVSELMPYLFRRAEENTSVKGQTSRELSLIQKEIKRRKGKK